MNAASYQPARRAGKPARETARRPDCARERTMKPALIPILRCPACRGKVQLAGCAAEASADLRQGELICDGCGARYEISDGITRLPPPSLSDFKRGEIEGWRNLGEGADAPAPENFDWRELPHA